MKTEKLLAMADQIATFFRSYPADEAAASVRKHLVTFWTPVMVRQLEDRVAKDAAGIDPLVAAALRRADTSGNLIERAAAPEGQSGVMASDAG